ncbi:helix-turn-helix domain-containing protein [Brachybacterium sp. GCM10030267]|uniref:helix-turn-helix domain-containing protein n=1 Tax=Brachybacterium sp. GCM10030267 TaxID=3273381 RepID=UPI00361672C2
MSDLPKFVPLEYIMAELSISKQQAYALVRSRVLRAIQVGGRGQWRVSLEELDAYIDRSYEETARFIHQDSNS